MMKYDPDELSKNARILWIVTSLVMVLYTLSGVAAAFGGVAAAAYRGVTGTPLLVVGALSFAAFILVGLVVLAPMRLLVEAALCLSRIEQHLAAQGSTLDSMNADVTVVEAVPLSADRR